MVGTVVAGAIVLNGAVDAVGELGSSPLGRGLSACAAEEAGSRAAASLARRAGYSDAGAFVAGVLGGAAVRVYADGRLSADELAGSAAQAMVLEAISDLGPGLGRTAEAAAFAHCVQARAR